MEMEYRPKGRGGKGVCFNSKWSLQRNRCRYNYSATDSRNRKENRAGPRLRREIADLQRNRMVMKVRRRKEEEDLGRRTCYLRRQLREKKEKCWFDTVLYVIVSTRT